MLFTKAHFIKLNLTFEMIQEIAQKYIKNVVSVSVRITELGLCRAEKFPARAGPGQKNSPKNWPGPGRAKTCVSKNRPGPKRAEKIMARAKKGQFF